MFMDAKAKGGCIMGVCVYEYEHKALYTVYYWLMVPLLWNVIQLAIITTIEFIHTNTCLSTYKYFVTTVLLSTVESR